MILEETVGISIGVDVVEISRMSKVCQSNDRFLARVFSEREREYSFRNKVSPYQHLAACFAAKEAFFKATNISFAYSEIEVAHERSGKPYFIFSEAVKAKLVARTADLTIAHEKTVAVCVVVVTDGAAAAANEKPADGQD